jgi:flagellin
MSVINTNVNSLNAQNALSVNRRIMTSTMDQLSTGRRVTSSKDDAAGVAVINTMTSQIRGLNQAVRNANDGISMLQTADGAMIEQTNLLQRMRELAVQSATDTVTTSQKGYLNIEYQKLLNEIDRIGDMTQWNDTKILDGTTPASSGVAGTYVFHVGAQENQTITVTFKGAVSTGTGMFADVAGTAINSDVLSNTAITKIDLAFKELNTARAEIGASINRLTYAADNLSNVSTNTAGSRSRIQDTDYAVAAAELARTQIIQQAGTAMLAQANQAPQSVLALLK